MWRPKTFSSASEISPTVAIARAASIDERQQVAVRRVRAGAGLGRGAVSARQRRTAGVLVALGPQPPQLGDLLGADRAVVDLEHVDRSRSSGTRYLLTPITGWRPESIRAWVRAAASSMRSLGMPGLDGGLAMPPAASTSWMCAQARAARSWVSRST